jgi:hypothetical protein
MLPSIESRSRRPRGIRELVRRFGVIVHGEPVYCVSCGSQDGYVPIGLPPGVIYLCGTCEATYGIPPEMLARPDLDAARTT